MNFGSDAGRCADNIMAFPLCMCSGFPTEKVEQMIVMSFYDITMTSHAIGGGKYIRKSEHEPQGCHLGFGN